LKIPNIKFPENFMGVEFFLGVGEAGRYRRTGRDENVNCRLLFFARARIKCILKESELKSVG
jgi:hypothetical protein